MTSDYLRNIANTRFCRICNRSWHECGHSWSEEIDQVFVPALRQAASEIDRLTSENAKLRATLDAAEHFVPIWEPEVKETGVGASDCVYWRRYQAARAALPERKP